MDLWVVMFFVFGGYLINFIALNQVFGAWNLEKAFEIFGQYGREYGASYAAALGGMAAYYVYAFLPEAFDVIEPWFLQYLALEICRIALGALASLVVAFALAAPFVFLHLRALRYRLAE